MVSADTKCLLALGYSLLVSWPGLGKPDEMAANKPQLFPPLKRPGSNAVALSYTLKGKGHYFIGHFYMYKFTHIKY